MCRQESQTPLPNSSGNKQQGYANRIVMGPQIRVKHVAPTNWVSPFGLLAHKANKGTLKKDTPSYRNRQSDLACAWNMLDTCTKPLAVPPTKEKCSARNKVLPTSNNSAGLTASRRFVGKSNNSSTDHSNGGQSKHRA